MSAPEMAVMQARGALRGFGEEQWRIFKWMTAQWGMSIWNPDLMNFLSGKKRDKMRLLYKARGVVVHDRLLNGERPL